MEQIYKFKYNLGDKITSNGRDLTIIDRKIHDHDYVDPKGKHIIQHKRFYKYRCNMCGNEDWIVQSNLDYSKNGCNVCSNNKVLKGVNDIATTAPWMARYFDDINEAYTHSRCSKAKVHMTCPDCGRHYYKSIIEVYVNGLACICGDSWTYPNKFMYALLAQIGVQFECERIFDWSKDRRYDNYIEHNGKKIITEQHGLQHYREIKSFKRSLKEEQENDKFKRQLALDNGIDIYLEINCSESEKNFIRNSIEKSGLLDLFNAKPEDIDWDKCDEFCLSNTCKMICGYKNEHPELTIKQIAKYLNMNHVFVLKSIQRGSKFGWCRYSCREDVEKNYKYNLIPSKCRPIYCISTGNYYRSSAEFVSCYEQEFGKKLCVRNIRSVCEGKRNHVNNLRFEYITQEQFNKIKSESPEIAHGDYFVIRSAAA